MHSQRRRLVWLVALGAAGVTLAACSPWLTATSTPSPHPTTVPSASSTPSGRLVAVGPPSVTVTPADGTTGVGLDEVLQVQAVNAKVSSVEVTDNGAAETLSWDVGDAGADWTYSGGLDVNAAYTVTATAASTAGNEAVATASFHTITSAKSLLTTVEYVSDGDTVGVGMPIWLHFNASIPAAEQPGIIAHIAVVSTPAQPGGWYWVDAQDVHYRPESLWQAGTAVTVNAQLYGVDAGNGYWGLGDWSESFTIGAEHVTVVDTVARTVKVYDGDPANGGQLLYTWPANLGKTGFWTLGGTLVVLYKRPVVQMQSCPTFHTAAACDDTPANEAADSYYNTTVYDDTAISTDGYFIHDAWWACPNDRTCNGWPLYTAANSSHGCVNLSADHAATYYAWSQVGDVVEVNGSPLEASYGDGEGDWQTPWSDYAPGGQDVTATTPAVPTDSPTTGATPTAAPTVAGP